MADRIAEAGIKVFGPSAKAAQLEAKFARLEARIVGPWFDGEKFSLVDAVFGPVFRYFDVFDEIGDFGILDGKPRLASWRENLAAFIGETMRSRDIRARSTSTRSGWPRP